MVEDRKTDLVPPSQAPARLLGWMGCLADLTRVRLLRILEQQELGVADLCDVVQLPQSSVSRHLKTLADGNWLTSRRQGTQHLYRMTLDELDPSARKLWLLTREQCEKWPSTRHDADRLRRLLTERQTESQAFFAGAAEEWEKLREELYGQSFTSQAIFALLPSDSVVADLGCGAGQTAAMIAESVGRVIGVDNSAAMLKAARRRIGNAANVDLRRGELEQLPIADGECDAALLLLALSYVPDPAAVLKESARILKPGGRVVIIDLASHDREDFRQQMRQSWSGFSTEQAGRLLADSGLTPLAVRLLPPEKGVKGPGLFLAVGRQPITQSAE